METRVDTYARWARALTVGSFAFLLGVAGHVSADGLLPGAGPLVALFGFSILLAVPVLGRSSPVRTVGLLVLGQTFIHLCLTLTAGHRGDPSALGSAVTPSPVMRHLPQVDGRRIGSLQDAYLGTSDAVRGTTPALPIGHLVSDAQAHAPMMLVHLAAAALVGLWIAYGERCLRTVLALTGRRLLALVRHAVPVHLPVASSRTYAAQSAPAGPRSAWLARPRSRRGPPLLLV